jgi:hypothetical protein
MSWDETMIARAIALQTLARKCVVLVDNTAIPLFFSEVET